MFSTRNFAKLFTGAVALLLTMGIAAAYGQGKSSAAITDDELGIRKGSLLDEEKVKPARTEYTKEAGKAKKMERSFENSPALIPHDIDSMLPITLKNNQCVECHMPDKAKQTGATPIPRSHLMKLAEGKDLNGKLDNERFNCVECHARESNATPPVKNTFKGGFKNSRERTRSDLADTVNEGVK